MSSRIKIAVLIDWYLPGTKAGGPVRSVYSLVKLLKDHYDFYILTTNTDLGSAAPYEDVHPDQWIMNDQVSYFYFSGKPPSSAKLLRVLNTVSPDVVYLNSFWSYAFSISALRLKRSGKLDVPVILAPRGMLGRGAMGLKSVKKQVFLRLAKMAGLYRSLVFHATNEQEALDIRKRLPDASVVVVPNINAAIPVKNQSAKKDNTITLFYLSRISRVKNLHFALEVLRHISTDVKVTYDIYGNIEDESYWGECKQLIDAMPSHVRVAYKGELPFHKVQEAAAQYNALFLPTLNENFGHSIVESLMSGCVVIISNQTPWTDVNDIGGFAIPPGDSASFVNAIADCARLTAAEFSARSAAAIGYITKKTDLALTAENYKTMFDGTVKDRPLHL